MSALAGQTEQAARAGRRRAMRRSRRAEDGTVTEMARALLHDARLASAVASTRERSAAAAPGVEPQGSAGGPLAQAA